MATAAQGAYAKCYAVDQGVSSPPLDYGTGVGTAFEIVRENLGARQDVLDTNGIRGTRTVPYGRTRLGVRTVGGSIVLNPSPADHDFWLPYITGAASGALGDTFSNFGVFIDRVSDQFEYSYCKVTRATWRGQAGQFLTLTLDIIGGDESIGVTAPTTAPTLATSAIYEPLVFHDACGLVDGGLFQSNCNPFDIEITIDNVMDARFTNCVTTNSITATDRIVTVSMTVPYDAAHYTAYRMSPRNGTNQASIAFTNATDAVGTTFTFPSLDGPDVTPVVTGKEEIVLRLDYRARGTDTGDNEDDEVVITNDTTPA